ncbi:DUF7289 family protein [Haloplanus aerogenes]|uniref:Flagellin-like protein n=1 Tax=Haloplanus aerogenes TaxID=660522 RepID=A0A3M0CYQ9_9EURY|nr:hypothetical protein [Haloplanus aerogenes]AZH24988.1 hypothetical protein DU502_06210 [Haloplanus aerogenes]RMB13795.1 hypothetical protein ATH50_2237 [Haloplanus aerogenes]
MTDDRAVSDVLSFILVFSLITASVGIVTVVGLGSLQDARNAERIDNGERAFEVLADNHRDIAHGGAPSRATEIKLAETTLTLADPSDSNVTLSDGTAVGSTESRSVTFGTAGDGSALSRGVVYELGAVFRVDRGGAAMRRAPPFQFDENRTVLHYVTLESRTGQIQRQSGSTTVLVRSVRGTTTLISHTEPTNEVTITVETEPRRAEAWKRYFETQLEGMAGSGCDSLDGSGTVSCSFETDDLRVTRTTIRVQIS